MQGRDAQLARVADQQFSVFARAQALECGFPEATIRRRLRTGAWVAVHPGVYQVAGARLGWEGRGFAAWLACGSPAAVGGRTAAAFWGLGVETSGVVSVLVPLSRRPAPAGVSVVRTRRWGRTEVARLGRLVVTSVPRTLLDLSAAGLGVEVEIALDAAHRLGRVDLSRTPRLPRRSPATGAPGGGEPAASRRAAGPGPSDRDGARDPAVRAPPPARPTAAGPAVLDPDEGRTAPDRLRLPR